MQQHTHAQYDPDNQPSERQPESSIRIDVPQVFLRSWSFLHVFLRYMGAAL